MKPVVKVLKLGIVPFLKAHQLQKQCYQQVLNTQNDNFLLILEHPPVYTVGIRDKYLTKSEENRLRNLNVEVLKTDRGGLITFHNPGQLIAYPILNLKLFDKIGIKTYIQKLEDSVIQFCENLELTSVSKYHPDSIAGIWVNGKKICSIGINAKRYITGHGLALNCNNDLSMFKHIKPCGIDNIEMTSLSLELNKNVCTTMVFDGILTSLSTNLDFKYEIL